MKAIAALLLVLAAAVSMSAMNTGQIKISDPKNVVIGGVIDLNPERSKRIIINLPGLGYGILQINWQGETRCYDIVRLSEQKQFKEIPCIEETK